MKQKIFIYWIAFGRQKLVRTYNFDISKTSFILQNFHFWTMWWASEVKLAITKVIKRVIKIKFSNVFFQKSLKPSFLKVKEQGRKELNCSLLASYLLDLFGILALCNSL